MKKPVIPAKLRILAREIEVQVHPDESLDQRWGDASGMAQCIRLSNSLPPAGAAHVLLHEVLHVYDDVLGLCMRHAHNDSLAYVFIDLIRNNPQLVTYIQGVK